MNSIEEFQESLATKFPQAEFELSEPKETDGLWILDVIQNQNHVVVEYSEKKGWGVSLLTDDTGYGEGPDIVFADYNLAFKQTIHLLGGQNVE